MHDRFLGLQIEGGSNSTDGKASRQCSLVEKGGTHIFVPHVGVCAQQADYLFLTGGYLPVSTEIT